MDPAFFRQLPARDARNVTNMAVSPSGSGGRKLCQIGAVRGCVAAPPQESVRHFCFSDRLIFNNI